MNDFGVGRQKSSAPKLLDPRRIGVKAGLLGQKLTRMVVGQVEAIEAITSTYQMYLSGLAETGRPVGSFLFLGPTGTGKTRIVEALAEALVGTPQAVIKIDCAEFQHSHEIAKLIGSPPGYLGHRETRPVLSQEVLGRCHTNEVKLSFVLFDEIEKASDAVWNLLLGILDKATLTLGDNRKVDFSRALIFMTSNLGAREMQSILAPKLGFVSIAAGSGDLDDSKLGLGSAAVEAARRHFSPEFMNRLDKVVVFKPLSYEDLRQVLEIELEMFRNRILAMRPADIFSFELTQQAKDIMLRSGTSRQYGARYLKRSITRLLIEPISNLIATRQVSGGDLIEVGVASGEDCLTFVCLRSDEVANNQMSTVFSNVCPVGQRENKSAYDVSILYGLFILEKSFAMVGKVYFPGGEVVDISRGLMGVKGNFLDAKNLDGKIVRVKMDGSKVLQIEKSIVMVGTVSKFLDGRSCIVPSGGGDSFPLLNNHVIGGSIQEGTRVKFVVENQHIVIVVPT